MKVIRQAAVAAVLCVGLVGVAEAHVFVGFGIGAPMVPMVAAVPVPVYAAPPAPVYYAPPPVYAPPVMVGYYGHPHWWYGRYGYGHGYWR
jgi:hypothetical protein